MPSEGLLRRSLTAVAVALLGLISTTCAMQSAAVRYSALPSYASASDDTSATPTSDPVTGRRRAVRQPVNPDAPVANADTYTVARGETLTVDAENGVIANDANPASAAVTAVVVSNVGHGVLTLDADGGFTYVNDNSSAASDSFTYQLAIGEAVTLPATVTISVIDQTPNNPTARNDNYSTNQDTVLSVNASSGILSNDTLNGATLVSYGASSGSEQTSIGTAAATSAGGTVSINASGAFTYTPASGFSGSDSFKYKIQNGDGISIATVHITVSAVVPNAPVATNDSFNTTTNTTLNVTAANGVQKNDTLNGATIVSYGASTGLEQTAIGSATPTSAGGTVSLTSTGSFTYNPAASFSGSDSFKYKLTNAGGSSTGTVNITVTAPAPTATNDSYNTPFNTVLSVNAADGVLKNDTLNGAAITSFGQSTGLEQATLGASTATAHGTVTLNADGSFSYTPSSTFAGNDSFKYVLSNGGTSKGAVTITVQSPPVDFHVTTSGFHYRFAEFPGVDDPVLSLQRGHSYVISISTSSIHPLQILSTPSQQPAPGVTNNDEFNGLIFFTVPSTGTFRYHCSNHDFGNVINTTP
jgi:VCBS repeat-containing protein